MTETVVALVVNELVQLIVHESNLLTGVHQEVVDIKDELESIQGFLKDVDKGDLQDGVKMWVKQVREAAYHIEDVIDEYVLHVAQLSKIQDIKISIREIKERSERYGFSFSKQGSSNYAANVAWHDPRAGALFIEEDEVVGIESSRDELVSWLVGEASKRSVMSVVGMGGIGKTTLAKKVYENESVKGHFDCRVWITVSQSCNVQKILMSMIDQIYQAKETTLEQVDMIDEITLITQLRKYLQQKRYVVFFDDVWKTKFWEIVKHALPYNGRGSRIIITTRSDLIGAFCKESFSDQVHKLQPLSQDKAWELFCKKAFWSEFQGCCPKELVKMSMDIVRKCEGLPLAIVSIGGLLSTKEKVPLEWKKLHDNLNSELEFNPHLTKITKILSLSYDDLPCYLESCYLYFGIFPEDYSITGVRLLWLWVAEGFIKGKKGKTLEDVVEESFIVKFFRKFKLLKVLDFEDALIDFLPQEVEHIALKGRLEKLPNWIPELQNLSTLLLFFTSLEEDPLSCVQVLPNLNTLSLNHAYDGEQLHFENGGFRILKKLTLRGLKRLKMVEIDKGSLPILEQLDIGPCSQMKEVPSGFLHLKSLKILDFYEMQVEFVLCMLPDGGQDFWKVKKVTTIHVMYRIKRERYQIYKLNESDLLERLQESVLEE
ncbi:disease resistance protein RPM1-like [Corylus avellana]|uniref:disease resistance protein RPM1-like n=1 Tax=Corylus avellana TaxID=13451 RepID=UPI00286BB992|nr:disease resistance protein RPM1-like [Corylus avellana]